jgi:penicillin-binding protein 1A
MTGAYTAFANNGDFAKPVYITRIEDANGNEIYTTAVERRQALNPETAWVMINMLRNVVDKGTAQRLRYKYKINSDVAGKTGTTQNHSDGWFMACTPQMVMGCWVGADDPSVKFRSIAFGQGASMALPIVGLFMQKVYADSKLGISTSVRFTYDNPQRFIETDCSRYAEIKGTQYEPDPIWEGGDLE